MVPSIANWPVCKSGSVLFAGIVGKDGLKPVVEKVDFNATRAMPLLEATVKFALKQLSLSGCNLFCATWPENRLIVCHETEPMVFFGSPGLNCKEVLKNLEPRKQGHPANNLAKEVPVEWQSNLDRHFWNFLQIVERTSASRTLLLGFGPESFKMGISEGAIHEPGKLGSADCIARKFRSTARARRKITYLAGARRRKKTADNPIKPLQLAQAFAVPANSALEKIENSGSWLLDAAGWPFSVPAGAEIAEYREVLSTRKECLDWVNASVKSNQVSYFVLNVGSKTSRLVRYSPSGMVIESGIGLTNL